MSAYFAQECPTCGRTLHVHSVDADTRVVCQHCRGAFVAAQPQPDADYDWRPAIMRRADELLALADTQSRYAAAS